jgi:hypothetical protein
MDAKRALHTQIFRGQVAAYGLRIEGVKIHLNAFAMGEMEQTEIDGCASYYITSKRQEVAELIKAVLDPASLS